MFSTLDIDGLSPVEMSFRSSEWEDANGIVLHAIFAGHAYNSQDHQCYTLILAGLASAMVATEADAVILDFTRLRYEWGDQMAGVLSYAGFHPIETGEPIPVAVIYSALNRDGLTSLVRDEMDEEPSSWLHADFHSALTSITDRLSCESQPTGNTSEADTKTTNDSWK